MVVLPGVGKEESSYRGNTPNVVVGSGATRPRPPALWSAHDVVQWLNRHCGDLGLQYSHIFHQQNVNGRTLLRMNSAGLERMGIVNIQHREEIWREIIKLKLKSDILELRDLELQVSRYGSNK